jgi:hypothetical protein
MKRHVRTYALIGAAIALGLAAILAGIRLSDLRSERLTSPTPYGAGGVSARSVATSPPSPPTLLTSALPPDVAIPEGVTDREAQMPYFDDFSWLSFIALNWRAEPGTRNVPSAGPGLDDPAASVVWETWKADFELFSPKLYATGNRPAPWASWEQPEVCPGASPGRAVRTLSSLTKFGPSLEDLDTGLDVGPLKVVVAQNRTYVRYETRFNQRAYESIRGTDGDVNTHLYLRKIVQPRIDNGPKVDFAPKSTVVKAAWKELRMPGEAHSLDRYHRQTFAVVRPNGGGCDTKVMGLVGLHIVRKTPTRPQWIWSTFEHVDNVPEPGEPAEPGRRYSFHDPANVNGPTNEHPGVVRGQLDPNPAPVQLERRHPIRRTTKDTNARYRGHPNVAGAVWANYQLVATQWPISGAAVGTSLPVHPDDDVRNVTLEPYERITCLSCHVGTTPTDFNWLLNLRAQPRDSRAAETLKRLMRAVPPRQ